MLDKPDFRDYINKHPRYSEAVQKAALVGGTLYIEDRTGKIIDKLIGSVRKGSIVRVLRPFLLAPVHGRPQKRRRLWAERVERIKAGGGKIVALQTAGVTGAKMAMVAYEEIASSGRGAAGREKSGRPRLEIPPERLQAMTAIWCSRQYKTRKEAQAALKAAGYDVSIPWCYHHLGMPTAPKSPPTIPPPEKKRRKRACFIYFLRDGDLVKIGRSTNPTGRMRNMAIGNGRKLEMLAIMPGDHKRESALHRRFHKHHIRGEWFHLAAPVLKYIAQQKRRKAK